MTETLYAPDATSGYEASPGEGMLDFVLTDFTEKITDSLEVVTSLGGIAIAAGETSHGYTSTFAEELARVEQENERRALEWFKFEDEVYSKAANLGGRGEEAGWHEDVELSDFEQESFNEIAGNFEAPASEAAEGLGGDSGGEG